MFDVTKPVRNSGNDSATVKILGEMAKADEFRNRPMLVILVTDSTGAQRIGYRNLDGTHPNGYSGMNLVNIDTAAIAHCYQTLISDVAVSIKILWQRGYRAQAVSVMQQINSSFDARDIRHYFTGLFGDA